MEESMRVCLVKLEDTLFNGNSNLNIDYAGTNYQIYGYTNHPNRGTFNIGDWTVSSNSELIVTEAIAACGQMYTNQGGVGNDSLITYVANDIWTNLQNDHKADSEQSILARLKRIAYMKDVKPSNRLANGTAVMVEMMSRTVQMSESQSLIVVPHVKTSPLSAQFMTAYAVATFHIKSDRNDNTGIMHLI